MFKSSFSGRKLFRGQPRQAGDGCDRGCGEMGGAWLDLYARDAAMPKEGRGCSSPPAVGTTGVRVLPKLSAACTRHYRDRQAASTAFCLPLMPAGNAFTGGTATGGGGGGNQIKSNKISRPAFKHTRSCLSCQSASCFYPHDAMKPGWDQHVPLQGSPQALP